jgi:predicted xylose isomerase-like sugar epimerase
MKYLKYTHASAMGYNPEITYSFDEVSKVMSLDKIKMFFEPIGFEFSELDNKKSKSNVIKEISEKE